MLDDDMTLLILIYNTLHDVSPTLEKMANTTSTKLDYILLYYKTPFQPIKPKKQWCVFAVGFEQRTETSDEGFIV